MYRERVEGGAFPSAGGVSASNIAAWNGLAWRALGTGLTGALLNVCRALCAYHGDLVAGETFTVAGGQDAPHIARW